MLCFQSELRTSLDTNIRATKETLSQWKQSLFLVCVAKEDSIKEFKAVVIVAEEECCWQVLMLLIK